MKPVHGDTVSNDSSSSAWCSYSNQSGLSFRRLSTLQGARTDLILQEKYIPLKENNLLEKLVKTRVLYEELRHQILSSSLSTPSKGSLISATQPLVVGKHLFKANKSKIIQLVDLVDKGVILRPEKLCECCASSHYNSETRYEYGPKERRQRQIHTGGYLTSKSSIISKKTSIGESRLEIRFKTKNIKSDPCTFRFKEFMKQKSREALKRNPVVQPFSIDGLLNKKSHKLKRSKPHLSDGVKLSVSKIKQKQPIKDIKKSKSIAKKSLDTVISHCHFLKIKPCCCSNVIQNTSTTDYPFGIVKREILHQKMQDSNSKFDMKIKQNCYVDNWNYNFECPTEMSPRDCSGRNNHRIADSFLEYLPFTSDVKEHAECSSNRILEKSKSLKNNILAYRTHSSKILKQNENLSVLGLCQTIKSKENSSLVLHGQNSTHLAKTISMLLATCKRSARLLSIDSMPKVDSGLLINETNCKTLENSKTLSSRPIEVKKTCYKNINMLPSDCCTDYEMKVMASNCTVLKKRSLDHSKHSNSSQDTHRQSSNVRFNFSKNFIKSASFSENETKNKTENQHTKLDHVRQEIQNHTSLRDKGIVDPPTFAQHHKERRNLDRKLQEHRQKRISKSIKIGSHALKRCFCTLKLKTMNMNNERHKISYINECIPSKTFIKIKKSLPCQLFLCASGEYVSTKCDSWKIQYNTGLKLISKSLTALEQYRTISNLLQVKTSHYESCRIETNYKNILENSWPVQNKKSETGYSLDKTKRKFKKPCSRKHLCMFNQTNISGNIIPKAIKLSKSTMVSLDHIVPKRVAKESEVVEDVVPSLTKRKPSYRIPSFEKRIFNKPITGVVIINDAESTITPSVKRRKTKSGTFRSQPVYKLLEINKVQSIANTYDYSNLMKNNEVHRNHHSESQKFIGNDPSITKEFFKKTCLSNHNIIHENPECFDKKHTNILKSSWKGSPPSKKYKLIKIQNETYLMISSSSKHIFSTLQKNNCVINDNATPKRKYESRNVGNRSKYSKESNIEKGKTTELLIKPRYIQVHANEPQKSKMNKRVEKGRHRENEIATQVPQNNYESHICESKGLYKSVQLDKKYSAKWGNVKDDKNVSKDKFNSVRNPQKQQCFLRKSSSILSMSSTFAIKSQTLQSYFQSKFKIFHLKSSDEYETLQINSNLQSNPIKRNVMTQSSGRSLDIKPSSSSSAIAYPSEIVKPVNPHLTGISSLLRRCFCTMNLQVGDGGESSKFQYKLKPYECAPYDCVPYECQKNKIKRLTRKVSSTRTERILKSSSNETSKNKKHQLVSMSEPKKSKSHRKVICDCRSNYSPKVKSYEKKPCSKTCYKVMKNEGIRSDRTYRHIGHKTQSNMRKIRNKSSSIGPMLKRCLCTVKLLKSEEQNKTSDVSSVSTSTQSTNRRHSVRLNKNIGNDTHPVCNPGCYFVDKYPESKINRKKNARDPALSVSSIQSYKTKRKRKYIGSKSVYEKPVRSKELREQKRLSTPSARQAVRVGSNFSFSLEFYKDKTDKKPSNEVYQQENRKYKGLSPNRSFRNIIIQKDRSLTSTGSQASPVRQAQPTTTGSFLKRCFCIKKKRSPKKVSNYTTTGTEEIIECQCNLSKIECECAKFIDKKQSMDKASGTDKHRGFVLKKCDCIKLINKGQFVDKPSWADKHPRLLVSKECECKQVIDKKHQRSIGSETEKQVTKFKSSSATSSKTSKARILHSSQYRQIKPNLLPETVRNQETIGGSSHRQAVRIGSNFSFEIEFHKDVQFPSDEKVQAAAEAIKETRDKMKDTRQMAAVRNKSRIGSSLYSLSSEINTSNKASKAVGPLLRKCIYKCSHQNNELLQNYNNKSKLSVHRGTATPVSRPIPNFHNRGVMTVYKLKTYPYKLAPYECEPGVCIPGECDPYECLKRMNRRHRGSSTDGYSTKSTLSMTRPARRYRDNRVQFSSRDERPHIRQARTRPREGIEVRQKPRQNKTRQAVKIGSNFSFNVEFYKDKSQGGGTTGGISPKPCPKPCPIPCPELCPKTCPKRFMSSGTDAANLNYRSKKAQRNRGQMHNRESQVWGRKMRSTMTGVGPFLKRCFCTLQLQRRHEKVLPRREERRDSDSSSVGTETARFRPEPHYKEQGTRTRRHHRYHGRKLDPNECEPGVCIPGQCDPYVCLERIKRRGMHTRHAGTGGRHRMHSVSSSMTEPGYRRHRNRSVSSSMMDHSRPRHRGQITHNQYRHRRNERPSLVKERTAYSPTSTSHRQAVRIGSSFSFNIEFYKDRNEQAPHVSAPIGERREHGRPSGAPVRYIKRPVPGRRLRTDSTGSGPMSTRTRSMASSYKNNLRNRRMQVHSRTLLKRCFCTLKLQKIGTRQRQTQESTASIGTYYKAAGAQIRRKQEIVPQYRDFGTRTKRRRLEPYECEPGVCIPGQCDPYECLERIKRRHLRHSGTGMAYPHTRSMSNLTPYNFRTTSMNTAMGAYRTPGKKYHRRYIESPRRIKQPPPRPSRALENIHNRQAVRLGSSFSFNVEFYKDGSGKSGRLGVTNEAPCRPSVCQGPTCSPAKCKTSTCSVSCPVKSNQRSRPIQYQGGGHDRMVQARNARTESRGSGVPLLKRCFCTLTLQRAEVNSYMVPLRARLYSEKSTSTKNKYFYSESEQQADLMSDYCTPNICMSECVPDNSVEPIKKRGLRRISRTTGNHMVRSRDTSTWYRRHPSERVETIVEEPRFQIFNKPNTKQTVRISSNFNFNIEFFKDILFPEPCEVKEEFDEMSAVTEAINPQHKRKRFREDHYKPSYGGKQFYAENYHPKYKHKNIRDPIYEGDKLFSIEHYRPKIRSHKSLTGKEQDEHRKKIKPGKEFDEHSKKLKPEVNKPSKKTVGPILDEHSKNLKPEVNEPSKKTVGPINKMFKCLCVSKGNKCTCPLDKNKCLCSTNEKKKYKCLCPSTELNGKKISNLGKKSKVAENIFANKTTTIARVEMGFYKQRLKSSTTRTLPTLNSSKFYLTRQPQHAKVTLGQTNENRNDLLCRNLMLLQPKPEYDEPKEFSFCQVSANSSISKILYLYSPNLFWTTAENRSRPCTFSSNVQSITSLQMTEEKNSSKLLSTKFKLDSKALSLATRNILVFESSEKIKALSMVTVSQKDFSLPNNPCSKVWPKTKSLHNPPFKADMRSRIETKFVTQKYVNSKMRQGLSKFSKSRELLCCKITPDGANETKNKISNSGMLLKFLCSSKLRKTKSEDVRLMNEDVRNSMIVVKSKCSTCNTSYKNLQRKCFCTTQVGKMKTELCESIISVAGIDKSRPLSIFTPKEYWVQYQIQHPKLSKSHKDKQIVTHSESNQNQPAYAKLETIMPYVPHKFHRIKSKMLFNRLSKVTCNNICCLFCRSNCKLEVKGSSDKDSTCFSACECHNQLPEKPISKVFKTSKKFIILKNESNIGSIKIEPWDPSRTNLKTLICYFIRVLSSTKIISHHCFVLKTSKHCIKFTPAGFYSKSYKSSIDKCTFKTSSRKKYITINKYQRAINSDGVVNFTNSRKTGIKLVKKPHGYCQAHCNRTCQHRHMPSTRLISKDNTNVSTSHGNEMEIFLVQSGSCNVLRKNIDKPIDKSKDTKSPAQTVPLFSSSFYNSSRYEFVEKQRKISSHSVKLNKATSNLRNLLWCSNCNNYKINNIGRSFISNYKKRFLPSKFNEHVYFEKLSKDGKKSCLCYFCKKKCISRYPKFKNKIKSKNAIDFTTIECRMSANPVNDVQNDRFEDIVIETLDLRDSETCVIVNKETTDTEDIESKKRDAEEKSECLKALKQDDIEKTKQIVRNYNYHLFMTKMLICMTKMGLTNRKSAVDTDYGSAFNPKRAYRHFKCILLNLKAGLKCASSDYTETASLRKKQSNFAKTIKNSLNKPTSKCLQSFKHIRKLHKRMLPKFLRAHKNTVDLGCNALDIACPQIKPRFSIYYMMPHFYSHFLTLVRVWRQLIDVLLFVLWSPCLFSAHLCKAFLCCLIRFRLHCYLK